MNGIWFYLLVEATFFPLADRFPGYISKYPIWPDGASLLPYTIQIQSI
jgi:hypothetical protein